MDNGRIIKELKDLQTQSKIAGQQVEAKMVGDNMRHWKGKVFGPVSMVQEIFQKDTCYEGGIFYVDIEIPTDYPFKPPKMKFDTKLWHPNVSSQTGAICLDILKNEWTPALTIRTALISLQALMCAPEPDDPQDAVVANMFKTNKPLFEETARKWVLDYATTSPEEKKVKMLMEMGFPQDQCEKALSKFNYDENQALNFLLGA